MKINYKLFERDCLNSNCKNTIPLNWFQKVVIRFLFWMGMNEAEIFNELRKRRYH